MNINTTWAYYSFLFVFAVQCNAYPTIPKELKKYFKRLPEKATERKEFLENLDEDVFDKLFPERWMEMPLNHFNLFDNRTWQMRYFVNDFFFKEGAPLFIEVGGEWSVDGSFFTQPLVKLAVKYNGMMVETEHRYYGKSLPFENDFSTENLKYLQIEQALEDLAVFIETFKAKTPGLKTSKVIIHGCSYPGMLVTWMRLRFPHIVDISYASSAPLGVGLDYPEYYEIVTDVYANVSKACLDTIKEGFEQTEALMKIQDGRASVRNALRGWKCGKVDEMSAGEILEQYLLVLNVMHDPYHYEDVGCLIMSMDSVEKEPYQRLAEFIKLKAKDQNKCTEQDDEYTEMGEEEATEDQEDSAKNVTDEGTRTNLAWSYQTCTEMGTFLTFSKNKTRDIYKIDLNVQDSVEDCQKNFGEMVTEEVLVKGTERVTRRYGGKKPKVTKVVTTQGTHDPWKHLAVLEDYNPEAPVLIFDGSHCADMNADEDESEEMPLLRQKVDELISKWLEEIYQKPK